MIGRPLAKGLYTVATRLRGEDVDRNLELLKQSQWFSPQDLRDLQWSKLLSLIDHAIANSPYYGRLFADHGLSRGSISSPDDLRRIPILTKEALRQEFDAIRVNNGRYKYSVAKTSGSTGRALKFYKDRCSSGNGRAAMYRGHTWYGADVGDREAKLWGVAFGLKDRLLMHAGDYLVNRLRARSFDLTDSVLNDFYVRMKRFKPVYLMGYSSLVYQFAKYLADEKIDGSHLALRFVKVTAETLLDFQRQLIEEVFDCPVALEYGAAEVGIVSFECPEHGQHIASENVYVEEMASPAGFASELVITDLNNYLSPIIRYRIADLGRLSSRTCPCGRGLPLLEDIQGRTSDIVYKADGQPVHSSLFSYVLKEITARDGGITQYRIVQEAKGRLRIELVRSERYSAATLDHLTSLLIQQLGRGMALDFQFVDRIARDPSGKLRYFVSRVP